MKITKNQFYLLQNKINEIYKITYNKNHETIKIKSNKLILQLKKIKQNLITLKFFYNEIKTITINNYILNEINYLYKTIINN